MKSFALHPVAPCAPAVAPDADGPAAAATAPAAPPRRADDALRRPRGFAGLFAEFWRHAAGQRHRVVLSSALLVGAETTRLVVPWLAAQAIGAIQRPGHAGGADLQRAGWMVAAILFAMCVVWAMHAPGRVIERSVALHVRRRVADALYARLTRLPLRWHETHHSGETLARVNKTGQALASFAQAQFVYLQSIVRLVGPLAALWALWPPCALAAAAGYAAIAALVLRVDRTLMRLAETENAAERRYGASIVEFMGSAQSVLSLRLHAATRALLDARMAAVLRPIARSLVLVECKWGAVDVLTTALTWTTVAVYVFRHAGTADGMLLGGAFMVLQYAGQAAGVVSSLAAHYADFARYRVDYSSADEILRAPQAPAAQETVAPDWQEIRVETLAYAHGARACDAPAGASPTGDAGAPAGTIDLSGLVLRRGEKIALIGPSGAGKSTMMRLLAGLYQADRAEIAVDGQPCPRLRDLGRSATYVPQDAQAFEASVRDNLTVGAVHGPDEIDAALAASAFDEVLAGLPQGLDTMVIERGQNLSGGQKQRLALARGLLAARAGSVVLLDEPTSALDAATEARVLGRVRQTLPGVTVIASIHRLAALEHFDRVVLMQAGRIVDAGTPAELAARSELFRRLRRGSAAADRLGAPAPLQAA